MPSSSAVVLGFPLHLPRNGPSCVTQYPRLSNNTAMCSAGAPSPPPRLIPPARPNASPEGTAGVVVGIPILCSSPSTLSSSSEHSSRSITLIEDPTIGGDGGSEFISHKSFCFSFFACFCCLYF